MSRQSGLVLSQGFLNGPKSTIVSLVPFAIDEFKPGLTPGQFHFDPCINEDEPVVQVVDGSIYYVYIDKERGSLKVPAPSHQVANSVVKDYIDGQLAAGPECHPAFFWLMGEWTREEVLAKHKDKVVEAINCQLRWYGELVKIADDDWEKTRQHYAISDFQRHAARRLDPGNTRNRPWLIQTPQEMEAKDAASTGCPACGSDIPTSAVICKYCQFIVDKEKYNTMAFAGSKPSYDLSKVPGLRQ